MWPLPAAHWKDTYPRAFKTLSFFSYQAKCYSFFLKSLTNSILHKLCAIRVRMYSTSDDVRKNQKHHQTSKDVQYKQVDHQGLVQEDTTWRYFPMNKSLPSLIYKAKIVNPSYSKLFRTHTLYQRGVIWTPYYLISTWLYKPQILQGIRDTLQRLRKHKVCKKIFCMVTMATVW